MVIAPTTTVNLVLRKRRQQARLATTLEATFLRYLHEILLYLAVNRRRVCEASSPEAGRRVVLLSVQIRRALALQQLQHPGSTRGTRRALWHELSPRICLRLDLDLIATNQHKPRTLHTLSAPAQDDNNNNKGYDLALHGTLLPSSKPILSRGNMQHLTHLAYPQMSFCAGARTWTAVVLMMWPR
jgi:hypothetical protein